ncbi:glycosyltransferase family 2 protein [Dyadobacter sp. CY312]|uniref:glycosyltransferase family 2 protein n=1 Tax=Dyadobacter sp. CY312 TaxID=2907303 RepID=UPI001F428051|nr:glycosyltransferase family 2 protein [Dyadobacter sp. CY312]MCE7041472.1 glycosyltransferase family 2 protein [Dyadobacter sp. CY312]
MKLVSIVTVNFNQPVVTEQLLKSLIEINTYEAIEIVVVDNGSSENPVGSWSLLFPTVQFVRSEVNLGFAAGNNLGIEYTNGDYIFLINNDTEVTATLISQLVQSMDANPGIGIISPKIHYYDHPLTLQYAGYSNMNYYLARNHCIGQFDLDDGQFDALSGVTGYAHGAAMMIRREVIASAGLMAENYFLYYEELDWCEQIKRAGYEVHTNLEALIYHKESVSVGKRSALKEYFMTRNRILFIRKNASAFQFFCFCCYFSVAVIPRNLTLYLKNKEFSFIPVFFSAIGWHFRNQVGSENLGYPVKR